MRKGSRIFIIVKMIFVCALLPVLPFTANSEEPKVSKVEKKSIEREWGPEVDGIQISIRVGKKEYRRGDRIDLSIVIRNNRGEILSYFDDFIDMSFSIIVKNHRGEIVPLTNYGRSLENTKERQENPLAHRRNIIVNIDAGEQKEYSLAVNSIYDMTHGIPYYITVSRRFGNKTIISNTITVTVLSGME